MEYKNKCETLKVGMHGHTSRDRMTQKDVTYAYNILTEPRKKVVEGYYG